MFATLFTIMVTTTLTRFLGRAADDRINSADVLPLIAFTSIGFIPVLLVLTVFLSILIVLSRPWRDSEMVVWFASGQSLTALLRPVFGSWLPMRWSWHWSRCWSRRGPTARSTNCDGLSSNVRT